MLFLLHDLDHPARPLGHFGACVCAHKASCLKKAKALVECVVMGTIYMSKELNPLSPFLYFIHRMFSVTLVQTNLPFSVPCLFGGRFIFVGIKISLSLLLRLAVVFGRRRRICGERVVSKRFGWSMKSEVDSMAFAKLALKSKARLCLEVIPPPLEGFLYKQTHIGK